MTRLIASGLVLLATGCSSELPPTAQAAAAAPAKLGMCVSCHGTEGISSLPAHPHLAGQNREYLISAMQQYQRGERQHAAMQAMMGPLSEQDIKQLADYYGRLPRTPGDTQAP
ncbi:c-type cytochrome [Pseudomarimonas arenosa]|uniref:Cytochrome c n=1 Tax=Pseudomarimonas arenosa TaxID=2774145 RepID=A0AAW3ZKA2_9GAMM|nr:cytochrome c [Pseudomarimonas arenosa]MBD8525134.1 cytochrome c [Pseudomarimonas arenosa]